MPNITFTLTDTEVDLLLDTLSHGANDIERDRYEQLRDGFKGYASELSDKLVDVNNLESKILHIIKEHKPKETTKANLDGIASNHPYYRMIVTLTDLVNELDEQTSINSYYFIELRHDLIHHNSNDDHVRLLVRGYLKSLLDMGAVTQAMHDKYFQQIEDYYWSRGEQ